MGVVILVGRTGRPQGSRVMKTVEAAPTEVLVDPQDNDMQPRAPDAARDATADLVVVVAQEDRDLVVVMDAGPVHVPLVDRVGDLCQLVGRCGRL